jgi:hypothetical protein
MFFPPLEMVNTALSLFFVTVSTWYCAAFVAAAMSSGTLKSSMKPDSTALLAGRYS